MYARCENCNYETDDYNTKKELMKALKCKKKYIEDCKCPQCGKKELIED